MLEKFSRGVRSLLRQGGFATAVQDVAFSDAIVVGNAFVIKAHSQSHGAEIGRVVAEALTPTDCCYVIDVIVQAKHRKEGIAFQLLGRALQHSECATLVPVGIQPEAISFWAHVATNGKLPVRLGLEAKEVEALRFALRTKHEPV